MTLQPSLHDQALHWFARLQDDDALESDWLAFQDWLEGDVTHGQAYDALERMWVELDPDAGADAANDDVPISQNLARPGRRRFAGRSWLYPSVAAAAAVVLAVALWPMLDQMPAAEVYRTEAAPRTLTLADGSVIHMNRRSALTVRMNRGERSVTLADGEAAFDVAHDAARPFVILAGDHDVRVLGTAFNVLNHGERFAVSVERGVVAVSSSKEAGQDVRLTAGQQIEQTGAADPVLSRVDPERAAAWRQGVLIYRDAPLSVVADDLSRYFDKAVVVAPSAQGLRFTGALQVGDEARMLGQLQDFVPIAISRSAKEVRVAAREAN